MEPDPEDEDDQLNLRHFTPSKSQWKEPLECDQDFVAEEGSRVYVDENGKETSWIEKQAESRRLYNQRQRSGLDESDTDLLDFIQSFREDDEAEILLDFCHGANVESLRADKWNRKETLPKNIWIDERSCRGQVPCSRPNPGPVTAHGAFQRLRKPVSLRTPSDAYLTGEKCKIEGDNTRCPKFDVNILVCSASTWSLSIPGRAAGPKAPNALLARIRLARRTWRLDPRGPLLHVHLNQKPKLPWLVARKLRIWACSLASVCTAARAPTLIQLMPITIPEMVRLRLMPIAS